MESGRGDGYDFLHVSGGFYTPISGQSHGDSGETVDISGGVRDMGCVGTLLWLQRAGHSLVPLRDDVFACVGVVHGGGLGSVLHDFLSFAPCDESVVRGGKIFLCDTVRARLGQELPGAFGGDEHFSFGGLGIVSGMCSRVCNLLLSVGEKERK